MTPLRTACGSSGPDPEAFPNNPEKKLPVHPVDLRRNGGCFNRHPLNLRIQVASGADFSPHRRLSWQPFSLQQEGS